MFLVSVVNSITSKSSLCLRCRAAMLHRRCFNTDLEKRYTEEQKQKILEVINDTDTKALAGYEITKARLKKVFQWKSTNGLLKTLSEVELIDGFSEKTAAKLFDSILEGSQEKVSMVSNKVKGQILHPSLSDSVREGCTTVLSVYISVNSVCWTFIDKSNYEVLEWHYYAIDYPEGKKLQITDIMDISWNVTQSMPSADLYVMKAEATTLRAAGSDPSNPKVMAVNLQKAQLTAMIVALINARNYAECINDEPDEDFSHAVYFLRPTLPYRLYGTLVGNEKVSTEQTIEMLLKVSDKRCPDNSNVYIPQRLQTMFQNQNDLQKDMLGHSLLLGLTFMDLCIYRKQESITKLNKRTYK